MKTVIKNTTLLNSNTNYRPVSCSEHSIPVLNSGDKKIKIFKTFKTLEEGKSKGILILLKYTSLHQWPPLGKILGGHEVAGGPPPENCWILRGKIQVFM